MVKMKWIAQGLMGAFLLLAGTQAYAATYYFSTSGNNTTGNGSQATPWYSLCGPYNGAGCQTGESKISLKQYTINPGDQLLFKRGDEWIGMNAVWTVNVVGTPTAPITFGAWGDPNLPRPVFRGARTAFELGKDTWTNVPGTFIWYTTGITTWPNMAAQEESAPGGPQLYGAWSVQGITNANGWMDNQSMVRGTYYFDSTAQRFYVWRTDNQKPDHAAGRDIYIGVAPNDGTNRLVKVDRGYSGGSTAAQFVGGNYIFQDLHVKMARDYGFSTSYPNTQYINCISEMNGMEGFLFDRVRFGAPLPGAKDGVMRNCISRRNNLGQGNGIGQGITVEAENVWIYDSESYENGFAGLDFLDFNANTKTDGSGVVNCKFHNNGIQPVTMYSFDANLYIDGGSNITVRDSQFWGAGIDPRGVKTRVRPNVGIAIDLEEPAFAAGKRPHGIKIINNTSYGNAGAALSIGQGNGMQNLVDSFSDIQLIGNTFHRDLDDNGIPGYYGADYYDAGIRVVQFANVSSGLVFKNNIMMALNTARAPLFGDMSMFTAGKNAMDFDYNIYYCPGCDFNTNGGYNSGGFFSYDYIKNLTIDQFRNVSAAANLRQDQTLLKTVITANPLLANAASANYDAHLLSNSPAVDIALTSAFSTFTMTGTTRADGAADNPYNDLGYHYPLTGAAPPPPPADTQAPSAPSALTAVQVPSQNDVALAWLSSVDNVAVVGYQVFDGTNFLGTTPSLGYTLVNAVPGQAYNFMVKAFDAAGNTSSPSNAVTLTTVAVPLDTTAPSAPTGLTATVSGSQVTLSWTASTDNVGVVGYEIMNNGQLLGTSVSTSFVHNGSASSTYNYTVRAGDASSNMSTSSAIVTVTTPAPAGSGPGVPTNLVATYTNGQVQLSWTASTNAYGYNVYRNSVYLKSIGQTSSFDNAVTAGTTYTYTVKAYDTGALQSGFSNAAIVAVPGASTADTTAPSAPANLAASLSGTTANLTWSASTDNVAVTGYRVFHGTTLKDTVSVLNYSVTGLAQGQTHSFNVKAIDAAGNTSSPSNAVTLTTVAVPLDTTAPSAPTGLTATVSGSQVTLSWTASTDNVGVVGYEIMNNGQLLGTSVSTSFVHNGSASSTYNYTVRAGDASSNMSTSSAIVTVTTPAPAGSGPGVPTNLVATYTNGQVQLSWTASTNAYGYNLFRNSVYLKSIGQTFATDNAVIAGTTYTYTVKAYDTGALQSGFSNAAIVAVPGASTADTTAPSAPANLAASLSGTTANLTWSASTDNVAVTGYRVFDGAAELTMTPSLSYSATGLSVGSHTFTVKALDAAGNLSGESNAAVVSVASTAPGTPTNLIAYLSNPSVSVAWSSATNAAGYSVYRNGTLLVNVTSTSLTDSNVTVGQTYSYKVLAYNATDVTSGFSNSMSVTVPAGAPSVPGNFRISASTSGNVTMSWSESAGAEGYNIYRNGLYLKTVWGRNASDRPGAGTWRYKVQAYNSMDVRSGFTNELSVTTTR